MTFYPHLIFLCLLLIDVDIIIYPYDLYLTGMLGKLCECLLVTDIAHKFVVLMLRHGMFLNVCLHVCLCLCAVVAVVLQS